MKATEASLLAFLKKSPQFVIPIYQRTYSWTEKECRQLWSDIIRAGSSLELPHSSRDCAGIPSTPCHFRGLGEVEPGSFVGDDDDVVTERNYQVGQFFARRIEGVW
ncbi:DUF262 domain-containing protein [Sphingorhabdus sp. SMR4y]|uniref:DUF262 domain-containing protein n=1 Tax=Sphingorhabdus sp. SMR4y TaxID=2584094 RepID=UPI000B5C76FA|nr:DUF262 domain-containing protein [Sphingorhabdus sp. SMR4y]ASK88359.1 hypothetical protein SPHFLASMR4Y_01611 [Sphingorhabdus sp. SMR4y]